MDPKRTKKEQKTQAKVNKREQECKKQKKDVLSY